MSLGPTQEGRAIEEIIERLSDRYPKATPEQVQHAVADAQRHFNRAAVRDFVPILIEREARARLERPL
jgi:hypothetical protein